jgi:hypothetical protein
MQAFPIWWDYPFKGMWSWYIEGEKKVLKWLKIRYTSDNGFEIISGKKVFDDNNLKFLTWDFSLFIINL